MQENATGDVAGPLAVNKRTVSIRIEALAAKLFGAASSSAAPSQELRQHHDQQNAQAGELVSFDEVC